MLGRPALAAVLVLTAVTLGAPSGADAKPKSKKAKVKAYKKKAFRLFSEGDFGGGIEAMEKANALIPHPGFLLNIAVAYDQWGEHCPESLAAFERFFAACPTCALRAQASRKHAEVKARCRTEVVIDTIPSGARLTLGGEELGVTPVTVPLSPGRHTVVAVRPGYQRMETDLLIEPGGQARHVLRLDPAAVDAPPPPPPPPARTDPAPPPTISAPLAPLPEPRTDLAPWKWTALGVGVAGAAVGAVFTFQTLNALDAEEQARADRRPKREVEELQDKAVNDAIIAHVGYGVGAAGLVAGVLLWILDDDDPEPEPTAVRLTPALGPGGVGVVGRF